MRSTDSGASWEGRVRVNQDGPWNEPLLYDQFMPCVTVDANDRVHVIWYDTRNDPHEAAYQGTFEIEAYYAWADDSASLLFTEHSLGVAIDTADLKSRDFIGDYSGLTYCGDLVVPVYMGTAPALEPLPGDGMRGGKPRDEAILSNRILWP
ncbi:MAG: hypothetical protein KKB50_10530 [Planctomycetes bacterium]|nr:hypothetical protein [Planctomycetota bacterium]